MKPIPATKEALELFHQGLTMRQIAQAQQTSVKSVSNRIRRAREQQGIWPRHRQSALERSGDRCRCNLRLPCNDCLPTRAHEYAERMQRPEAR